MNSFGLVFMICISLYISCKQYHENQESISGKAEVEPDNGYYTDKSNSSMHSSPHRKSSDYDSAVSTPTITIAS